MLITLSSRKQSVCKYLSYFTLQVSFASFFKNFNSRCSMTNFKHSCVYLLLRDFLREDVLLRSRKSGERDFQIFHSTATRKRVYHDGACAKKFVLVKFYELSILSQFFLFSNSFKKCYA